MKRGTLIRFLIALVVAGGSAIWPGVGPVKFPEIASANSACSTSSGHYYDGYGDFYDTWGASAWIVTRSFNFCTEPPTNPLGDKDFISAWSMVVTSDLNHFAQVGYGRYKKSTDTTHVFAEYTYSGCSNGKCKVDYPVQTYGGDNIKYWNAYHNVSSPHPRIEMWAGDCQSQTCYDIAGTPYDPANTNSGTDYWPSPWYEQYSGETKNTGDDVPGSVGYKASFTSVAYLPNPWKSSTYPTFQNVADYPYKNTEPTEPYYCFQPAGDSAFNIWTAGTC